MRKFILIIGISFFLTLQLKLNAQMIIDAELRPRFEMRDGYKSLSRDTSAAWLVSQRTRINFKFSNDKLKSNISIQDVRTWGEEALKTDVATFGLYEAWAEIPVIDSLSAKIGRQELIYGNQRILSNVNWSQKGISHDAFLLKYKRNGFSFDFGTAFNQAGDPLFGTINNALQKDTYKSLNFIWLTKKIQSIEASFTFISEGFQKLAVSNDPEGIEHRNTTGVLVKGKASNLKWFMQGYYQFGNNQDGTEISSYYLNPEFILQMNKEQSLSLGCEYISGNDAEDETNKKFNTFSTLYGSGHSFNGFMDYFTNMPTDTKNAGLVNAFLKYSNRLSEKCIFSADYHYFMLQNNYLNEGKTIDKYLGSEIDLSLNVSLSKESNLLVGYSVMKGTESMEIIKEGDKDSFSHWAVVMLTIKPSFFRN